MGEAFDLKKSLNVFFLAGDVAGLAAGDSAAVAFFLRSFLAAGDADASGAADAAGDASVVAFAFLLFFGLGDAEASVPAAADALASGEAPFFL